jgi:LDH2 family malate/lactate/ureidoglycolate dehydrogenase
MRLDAFRTADEFKADMDQWIRAFRAATPIAGEEKVLIPGDPERMIEAIRMQEGIPVLDSVVKDLQQLAQRFGIDFVVN